MPVAIKEFMLVASEKQRQLLIDMAKANQRGARLVEKVRLTDSKYFGTTDGITVNVCADGDDAIVVSAGPRQELRRVEEQMKSYLREAVKDPQMRELGLIQRQYQHCFGEPIPSQFG